MGPNLQTVLKIETVLISILPLNFCLYWSYNRNILKKSKILIPTNFGSGSEVTRISVLKVDGKKKSFHDDGLFANGYSQFLQEVPGVDQKRKKEYADEMVNLWSRTLKNEFNEFNR